jgi:hypothetical protein
MGAIVFGYNGIIQWKIILLNNFATKFQAYQKMGLVSQYKKPSILGRIVVLTLGLKKILERYMS